MIINDATPILDLDRLLDDPSQSAAAYHLEWAPTLRRLQGLDDALAPPPGLKLETWAALIPVSPTPSPVGDQIPVTSPIDRCPRHPRRHALVGFFAAATAAAIIWLALLVPLRPDLPTASTDRQPPPVASDVSRPPARADAALARSSEPAALTAAAGLPRTLTAAANPLRFKALTPALSAVSLSSLTPTGLVGLAALGFDDAHRQIVARQAKWETDLAGDQDALLRAVGLDHLAATATLRSSFHPA